MNLNPEYEPYGPQILFHESKAKHRGFIGGLGSGKTLCGAYEALITVIRHPGSIGIIMAPTYPMLRDSTIKTFMNIVPHELINVYNRTEQHIIFINGTEILFRPGNDQNAIDRLRNINVDWFWMDEAALFSSYAWQVLIGRLRGMIGPRRAWLTTTPKGFNWIWKKFVDKPTKDYAYVTVSALDNPYLPKDYIESLKAEYAGVFARQEIYGLFVGFEGVVYPDFNRATHTIDTSQIKMVGIMGGIDFGFTNPSVVLKIGFDSDGRIYVMDEFYEKHVTDSQLADWVKTNMTDVEVFIADSENPSGIRELQERNIECKGVLKTVAEKSENFVLSGIKRVSNFLVIREDNKPRLFVDKKCVNTIMEFENYRYPEVKEEHPEREAPLKIHDHAMDALRYVITTLGEEYDRLIYVKGEE